MKVDELYNRYMNLCEDDKDAFRRLIGATSKKSVEDSGVPQEGRLFYSILQSEYKQSIGVQLPFLSRGFVKSTAIRAAILDVLDWLQIHKINEQAIRQSLYQLAAECSVVWSRKMSVVFDSKYQVVKAVENISCAVEDQYPGYRATGMLHVLAQGVSHGKFKRVCEDSLPD